MSTINVTKSFLPPMDDYIKEINDIWETGYLTNDGSKHKVLLNNLKKYMQVDNAELLVNGHAAIESGLEALELQGEVITTPFTFASTTHAVVRKGLTPVFCDIKEDDYTIDPSKIENMITEKTSAILPVHVYGNICDVEAINKIADKYKLKVMYDAAHCFGEKVYDKSVASLGDISIFSFHATKVFHSIEGGMIIANNRDLIDKIRLIKNFGIVSSEEVNYSGGNYKMNELQAAMGICNLRYIDKVIEERKYIAEMYDNILGNIKGICTRKYNDIQTYNYAYYPIRISEYKKTRDDVHRELSDNGINSRKYFYPIVTEFGCYNDKYNSDLTPIAKKCSDQILCLPIYSGLTKEDVQNICNIITK